jgi:hypothetical protein
MRQFPKVLGVYTDRDPSAPVVFYELRTDAGYRELAPFLAKRREWEVTTGWTKRQMNRYRQERLKKGLPTPLFADTAMGWAPVQEEQWPLAAAPAEEGLFLPALA